MFNALLTLISFVADVIVAVVRKLLGIAFVFMLLTVSVIVTIILVLDHSVG